MGSAPRFVRFVCPVCGHSMGIRKEVAEVCTEPNRKFSIACSHKGRRENVKPAQMRRAS